MENKKQYFITELQKSKLDGVAELLEKGIIDEDDPILYRDEKNGQFPMAEVFDEYVKKRQVVLNSNSSHLQFGVDITSSFCDYIEDKYKIKDEESFMRVKSLNSIKNKIENLAIERIAKEYAVLADFDDISTRIFENYRRATPQQCKKLYKKDLISNLIKENNEINFLLKSRVDERFIGPLSEEEEKEKREYYSLIDALLNFKEPINYAQIVSRLCTNEFFSKSTLTAFSRIFYFRVCNDKERIVTINGKSTIEKIDERDRDEYKYQNFNYIPDKDDNDTNKLRIYYNRPSIERTESISGDWASKYSDPIYSSRAIRLLDQSEFIAPKDFIGTDIIIDDNSIPADFRLPEDTDNDDMNRINSEFNEAIDNEGPNDKNIFSSDAQKRLYTATKFMLSDAKINAINGPFYIVADSIKNKRQTNQEIHYFADHIKVAQRTKRNETANREEGVVEVQLHSKEIENSLSFSHIKRAGKDRRFTDVLKRVYSILGGKSPEEREEAIQAFANSKKLTKFFYDQLGFILPDFYRLERDSNGKKYYKKLSTKEVAERYYEPYTKGSHNSEEYKQYCLLMELIERTQNADSKNGPKIIYPENQMFVVNPNSKKKNVTEQLKSDDDGR